MALGITAALGSVISYKGVEYAVTSAGFLSMITGAPSSEEIPEGGYKLLRKPFGIA